MVRILTAAAIFAAAGVANAGISAANFSLGWTEIDNSVSPVTGTSPQTDLQAPFDPANFRTFRLFLYGDASVQGQRIDAVNFGNFSQNYGMVPYALFTDGSAVYNHPSGGNVRSTALEGFLTAVYFDTYAAFGNTAPGAIGFAGGVDFSGNTDYGTGSGYKAMGGAWFGAPGVGEILGADGIMLLQVTVSADATFLGGDPLGLSRMQITGPNTGGSLTLDIPNAIPTPGAAALLGLAGLATARRRR